MPVAALEHQIGGPASYVPRKRVRRQQQGGNLGGVGLRREDALLRAGPQGNADVDHPIQRRAGHIDQRAESGAPRWRAASIDSMTSAVSPLWERATTRLFGVRKCSWYLNSEPTVKLT